MQIMKLLIISIGGPENKKQSKSILRAASVQKAKANCLGLGMVNGSTTLKMETMAEDLICTLFMF